VIFYISFSYDFFQLMTGSVYYSCSSANKQMRFHVHCIKRALWLDMKTSLDFTQQQTYSEARYTHCSREKQNSSNIWINLTSHNTFNQTVKHSVNFVDSVCVGKFCILMSSKTLVLAYKPHPKFQTFFSLKKVQPTVNTVGLLLPVLSDVKTVILTRMNT